MRSSLPLSVGPQAEKETQRSARWYNNESPGLGEAFLGASSSSLWRRFLRTHTSFPGSTAMSEEPC